MSAPRSWRPNTLSCSVGSLAGDGQDPVRDLVHLAHAVDTDEQAGVGIVLGEGRGLATVDGLALPDDVLGVIGAALDLGALEQSLDDGILVDCQLEDRIERVPTGGPASRRGASTCPAVRG